MAAKDLRSLREKFETLFTPEPNTGCWLWCGTLQGGQRYGAIWFESRFFAAHRVAWGLYMGPIPDGNVVCHKCDVTICVNPEHLFLGTQADNVRDMVLKGRDHKSKGEAHYRSKVTAEQVRQIRKSKSMGESSVSLARKFNLYPGTIDKIFFRRTWKSVQ